MKDRIIVWENFKYLICLCFIIFEGDKDCGHLCSDNNELGLKRVGLTHAWNGEETAEITGKIFDLTCGSYTQSVVMFRTSVNIIIF